MRDAERESPVAVWILIDASASMAQADAARPDWSRLDAAKALAASLMASWPCTRATASAGSR